MSSADCSTYQHVFLSTTSCEEYQRSASLLLATSYGGYFIMEPQNYKQRVREKVAVGIGYFLFYS